MTIIVKLEELIEAIKKTDDVVFLQFVDNLIKEGELDPNLLPKDILWKIVNARKSEELTNNDIDSIDKVNSESERYELWKHFYQSKRKSTLINRQKNIREKIVSAIKNIPLGDVKPLKGKYQGFYRLHVSNHRILFKREDDTIYVYGVDMRGDVYK